MSDRIRATVNYDPLTGLFTRKSGPGRGGNKNGAGYIQLNVDGKFYYGHRLAWWFVYGEWPSGELDHINGDRSDNRIANLRLASRQQNAANTPKRRAGLKGVFWNTRRKKWYAQMQFRRSKLHLGVFNTEAEAHKAYCRATLERNGEFARFR
jgi:HNH endonuclease/AP2 domain